MKIAVSANGNDLDSPFSPFFGRCPTFVVVDTDTMAFQAIPNQAVSASGGAGIQAAQDVASKGVGVVITGSVGPNAHQALTAARLPVYTFSGSTVRQAVDAFKTGQLARADAPTGPAHGGIGAMHGHRRGMAGRGIGGRSGR